MLDTNIVSDLMSRPSGPAAQRARTAADSISVSIVTACGLRYGAARKRSRQLAERVEALLAEVPVLPLDGPADAEYGDIRAALEAAGRPIGANDMLIAAHARALDMILVTGNVKEFARVERLKLENWLTDRE